MSATTSSVSQAVLFTAPRRPSSADVYAYSEPAGTFTGDFYLTHRDGDRLWFALGDVSGKGLNAAVIMAMIQEELEHRITSCAITRCDPSTTMQRLHLFLQPLLPGNRFASIVIGHLRDDGLLTIANAGHCPLMIARRNGMVEEIGSTGPVAGLLKTARWTSVTRRLAPGTTVLLYSDGLLEARSPVGEEFGRDGIVNAFRRAAVEEPTARGAADRVLSSARIHAPTFDDDTTVLALRVT